VLLEQLRNSCRVLDELRGEGVIGGYALIGGLAVSTWSLPRATRDVDLLLLVEHGEIGLLVDRLNDAGFNVALHRGGYDDPVPLLIRGEELDIIVATKRLESEAITASIPVEIADLRVPVVSPEYLVVLKLKAGGPRDLLDVRELLSSTATDLDLARELSGRFRVLGRLEKIVKSL